MKTNSYKEGQYVVGWFNNIVKLGEEIILPSGQEGFKTDFNGQNISIESIERVCTDEEIKEYKAKYEIIC